MLKQEIKEKITKNCICLDKYGYNDLAWNKEDALNLLNSIMQDRIGILGGDVYKLKCENLEPLSDNWSCESINAESEEEFNLKSKIESLKYIKKYPHKENENILFSITFTEQIYL